jgi:hypothetical protein
MGKLILGIGVVILLQISFSIYMAIGERADTSSTAMWDTHIRPESGLNSTAPLDDERFSESAPSANSGLSPELSDTKFEAPTRQWVRARMRQPRAERRDRFAMRRRPVGRRSEALASIEPLVRREFFGGMMVETRYEVPSNRGRNISRPKSRREVFGRMIVEYKFAV